MKRIQSGFAPGNQKVKMSQIGQNAVPAEFYPPFDVAQPAQQAVPFVFSSPHSGRIYPQQFVASSRLTPQALRKSEDCLVDQLFAGVVPLGAPLISARFPRAYLDLNREPYELDPELVEEPLPAHANSQSIRVAGGLGTVARIVADGEEIYHGRLPLSAVLDRIDALYFPYHAELARLISETHARFGYAILVDCHSMPSAATAAGGGQRPDIVIGDRFGSSSDPRLSRMFRDSFAKRGYDVLMNRPYAGGYITEHQGNPARGVHALQIEINRGLYLDEGNFRPSARFEAVRTNLNAILADLIIAAGALFDFRAAAE